MAVGFECPCGSPTDRKFKSRCARSWREVEATRSIRRLNPHPSQSEEGDTRKFSCVCLGGVEGCATRPSKIDLSGLGGDRDLGYGNSMPPPSKLGVTKISSP